MVTAAHNPEARMGSAKWAAAHKLMLAWRGGAASAARTFLVLSMLLRTRE